MVFDQHIEFRDDKLKKSNILSVHIEESEWIGWVHKILWMNREQNSVKVESTTQQYLDCKEKSDWNKRTLPNSKDKF